MRVSGTSAVVTGGASGLGLATVRMLVEAGAFVVAFDLADRAAAVPGVGGHFHRGDVTDEVAMQHAVTAAAAVAPLRVLVNCAGIANPGRVVRRGLALPLVDFEHVVAVNLFGTFNAIRLTAAQMCTQPDDDGERGVIVNTASVAAFDGQVGQAAYSASKGAVAAMTLPLARDLAENHIRVMTIAPGMFRTPLLAGLPPAAIESLGRQVPHPARVGEPPEFAALVRHVIENPMLNGEVIRLDGAIRMAAR